MNYTCRGCLTDDATELHTAPDQHEFFLTWQHCVKVENMGKHLANYSATFPIGRTMPCSSFTLFATLVPAKRLPFLKKYFHHADGNGEGITIIQGSLSTLLRKK